MSPLVAPPSPGIRSQFQQNQSVKVTRLMPGQTPSPFAQPMLARTMRPPPQSPMPDHFAQDDGFGNRFAAPRTPVPFPQRAEGAYDQNPEMTRQLRELLQRQKEGAIQRPWLPNTGRFNIGKKYMHLAWHISNIYFGLFRRFRV